jgi:hypothetical protein
MNTLLPCENLAGAMQMVCYFFTAFAALFSWMTLRA